ncbi:MAG: hypothetical protein WCK85_12995 [Chlorobium sp.]
MQSNALLGVYGMMVADFHAEVMRFAIDKGRMLPHQRAFWELPNFVKLRLAGAVERFVCGSGSRVEVSKCRAVLGTAFAGGWAGRDGRGDDRSGCAGWRRVGLGFGLCGVISVGLGRWFCLGVGWVAQTERSAALVEGSFLVMGGLVARA